MAREDDEAVVDAALWNLSPTPVPAPLEGARTAEFAMGLASGSGSAERPSLRQALGDHVPTDESGRARPPVVADAPHHAPIAPIVTSPAPSTIAPSVPAPTPTTPATDQVQPAPSFAADLERQRRERAERLLAAEEEAFVLVSADEVVHDGDGMSTEALRVMPDGDGLGDGLRQRRRPDMGAEEGGSSSAHNLKPPDTTSTPTAADTQPGSSVAIPSETETLGVPKTEREGVEGGPKSGTATPSGDERQCRICFGGQEDEGELGRLISPCLCSGSMRYVHVKCINQWRGTGANAKSFMECPQCHHQYSIRRTAVSGLATSKPILYMFTTVLFLVITFICGHVLLRYLVAAAEVAAEADKASKAAHKDKSTVAGMTRHGDVWESEDGSVIIAAPGLTLVYDIVVEAVDIFLDLAASAYDAWPRDSRGLHTRASRMALATTIRLILGLSVLGSLSFLSLLASLSLFAPLQLAYTLFGTGLFRGPLENLRRRAPKAGGILVVIAVLIGVANSIVGVYDLVRAIAHKLLAYVETQILEVNPEEARLAREAAERQPHWFDTWITERRWRRLAGWYEVVVRAWEAVKELYRAAVAWIKASVEARVHAAQRAGAAAGLGAGEPVEPVRVG